MVSAHFPTGTCAVISDQTGAYWPFHSGGSAYTGFGTGLPGLCLPERAAVWAARAASYLPMRTARDSKSFSLLDMEPSSLVRRYLPRPIGQRARTPLQMFTYSCTRPLILVTLLSILTPPPFIPVKMEGIVSEGESPSSLVGVTLDMPATLVSRSPSELRFLPLPLAT